MTAPAFTLGGNRPGDGPLRTNGQSPTIPVSGDSDLPSQVSPAAKRQRESTKLMRDVLAGPERIRAQGTVYLPKAAGESDTTYRNRLARAVFFGYTARAVDGLTGLVFCEDPKLGDDVPLEIAGDAEGSGGLWENIDNAGTHGAVFCRSLFAEALSVGHAAVLVDFPKTGGTQTAGDEKGGIRPYWVPIPKENILSWRVAIENGRQVLTQVVLEEKQWVDDGKYGSKEVTVYRILLRGAGKAGFLLVRIADDKQSLVVLDQGIYGNQTEIPLVEVPGPGRVALFESKPPLLDMAYLNIAHYQEWSEAAWGRHKSNVPILVTVGLQMDPGTTLAVGADAGINISDPAGKAMYISHDGQALASSRQACEDLKSDMGTLGLAMLAPQKRAAETVEAKRLDKSTSDSALAVGARALQDAVERMLQFTANYLKLPDGGSIDIRRDFEESPMDAAVMQAYADLAVKLNLPVRVILDMLAEGGRLPEDVDLDQLEADMLAGRAAAMEAARINGTAITPGTPTDPAKPAGPMDIQYDTNGRPIRLAPAAA